MGPGTAPRLDLCGRLSSDYELGSLLTPQPPLLANYHSGTMVEGEMLLCVQSNGTPITKFDAALRMWGVLETKHQSLCDGSKRQIRSRLPPTTQG